MENRKKLDPVIIMQLKDAEKKKRSLQEEIEVLIRYKGEDVSPIEQAGFLMNYKSPKLLAGKTKLAQISTLAALEEVFSIQAAKKYEDELDLSIPESKADQVRSVNTSTHAWSGFTGKGVYVAIIDTGINFLHKSFQNSDGTSRIKYLWDKSLTPDSTIDPSNPQKSPPSFNLIDGTTVTSPGGVEYTKADIDNALQKSNPRDYIKHRDTGLHGSHVAGIAAGNGLQDDSCTDAYTYMGMAPEADIIFVKRDAFTDAEFFEVLAYILFRADDTPVAINMSFGNNQGPHDGTEADEMEIDRMLIAATGKAVIKSAGNQGNDKKHFTDDLEADDDLEIIFEVEDDSDETIVIDLWYEAAAEAKVYITPNGDTTKGPVEYGDDEDFDVNNGGSVEIFNREGSANLVGDSESPDNNLDNRVQIYLRPEGGTNASGEWKIKLENTKSNKATVHAWIKRYDDAKFKNFDRSYTITNPGNAGKVITVGSYNMRKGWWGDVGELSGFSSFGPTRDGRDKLDICAPGASIRSAEGREHGCCEKFWCWCCERHYHRDTQGTSMAAPHVTGAVALMLQKNPELTIEDIKKHLADSAAKDSFTGDPPEANEWGAGKLDVKKLLDLVPVPSGGGGSLTGPTSFVPGDRQIPEPIMDLRSLYQRFMATAQGRFYASLASKHADEIWELVNHNKRVATVWHRNGGRKMITLANQLLSNPSEPIPTEIDQIATQERLGNIAEKFYQYGSSQLKKDIEKVSAEIFPMIGMSINQILELLSNELKISSALTLEENGQ